MFENQQTWRIGNCQTYLSVEVEEDDVEAGALLANQVLDGDMDIVKLDESCAGAPGTHTAH